MRSSFLRLRERRADSLFCFLRMAGLSSSGAPRTELGRPAIGTSDTPSDVDGEAEGEADGKEEAVERGM